MKTFLYPILIYFLTTHNLILAQDTTYYYGANNQILTSAEDALYKKVLDQRTRKKYVIKTFSQMEGEWIKTKTERIKIMRNGGQEIRYNGRRIPFGHLTRKITKDSDKIRFQESKDGIKIREGFANHTLPLHLHGKVIEFYPDGKVKIAATYKNNELINNTLWLKDGTKYAEDVFFSVEKEPEYLIGQQHFNNYLLYSLKATGLDLTQYGGTILLGWVITVEGVLLKPQILESNYPKLNHELLAILKEAPGTWQPAMLDGENVNYYMKFPINFHNPEREYFDNLELSRGYLIWY